MPFDLSKLSVTGSAVPILDDARREAIGASQLTFSGDGWLAYIPGNDMDITTPVWRDRTGIEERIPLPARRYGTFSISPDGTQVALQINGPTTDVWLYDFERATAPNKLTVGDTNTDPVWSPDGQRVAFAGWKRSEDQNLISTIFVQEIGGGQAKQLLVTEDLFSPTSWSTNGMLSLGYVDIWVTQVGGTEEPEPFLRTSENEW